MNSGFYVKTAIDNIKKNYRFYIPQILCSIGLTACFYIVLTLAMDQRMEMSKGGSYIPIFMGIGTVVIGLLSLILILYTNSFLMKQRKREYGLYNILGLEKRHIGRIIFHETTICCFISVLFGCLFGVLFYKLCSLFICYLLQTDIIIGFYFITAKTLIPTALFFILLYLIAYLINRITISKLKPVDLMNSKASGEKEPKIKWTLLVIGVLTLGSGYYLAIATKNPLETLTMFFIAVFLVIIGTYFLFIAGSILVLKLLKKIKNYYYHHRHMQPVSGLLYRMKQNAVGLASICILSTGVLIMISSTVSLYSGMQEQLDSHYPFDLFLSVSYSDDNNHIDYLSDELATQILQNVTSNYPNEIRIIQFHQSLNVAYKLNGNQLIPDHSLFNEVFPNIANIVFITEDTYSQCTGNSLNLAENEVSIANIEILDNTKLFRSGIRINDQEFSIKSFITDFPTIGNHTILSGYSLYGIIVSNESILNKIYQDQYNAYKESASDFSKEICVSLKNRESMNSCWPEFRDDLYREISDSLEKIGITEFSTSLDSYWDAKESVVGMYGTLLFLGIILGFVCLFATALIIFYKQISEGYEDRTRFQIMIKIGMSNPEIKNNIRSQVMLVFFLPLITAGIHTMFAFPMINRLLNLFMFNNTKLFVLCTLISYVLFSLFYITVYRTTAKTYYKIVH